MISFYLGFILSWSFKTACQLYHNYTIPYSITNTPSVNPNYLNTKNKELFKKYYI